VATIKISYNLYERKLVPLRDARFFKFSAENVSWLPTIIWKSCNR